MEEVDINMDIGHHAEKHLYKSKAYYWCLKIQKSNESLRVIKMINYYEFVTMIKGIKQYMLKQSPRVDIQHLIIKFSGFR